MIIGKIIKIVATKCQIFKAKMRPVSMSDEEAILVMWPRKPPILTNMPTLCLKTTDVAHYTSGRCTNSYCSDVQTSRILGHPGLTVDLIRAHCARKEGRTYKIRVTQTHISEGNLPLEGGFLPPP